MDKFFHTLTCVVLSACISASAQVPLNDLPELLKHATPVTTAYSHTLSATTLTSGNAAPAARRSPMKAAQNYSAEITFWDLGLANSESVNGRILSNEHISLTFDVNSGINPPAYYDNGNSVRVYPGNTISVKAQNTSTTITAIEFTFGNNNGWTSTQQCSTGNYNVATRKWSGSAQEVQITANAKAYIAKVEIYYTINDNQSGDTDIQYLGLGKYQDALFQAQKIWNVDVYHSSANHSYIIPAPYASEYSPYAGNYNPKLGKWDENWLIMTMVDHGDGTVSMDQFYTGMLNYDNTADYVLMSASAFEYYYGPDAGQWTNDANKYGRFNGQGVITFPSGSICLLEVNENMTFSAYSLNADCSLALPGYDFGEEQDEIDCIYVLGYGDGLALSTDKAMKVNKSAGKFSFDVKNLTKFIFSTNNKDANTFLADSYGGTMVYGSALGKAQSLWHSQVFFQMPWTGNYHVEVAGDFSTITFTTTTSRPTNTDIYLSGDFNSWAFNPQYKFTRTSAGHYELTVPADIAGEWKIGSSNWIYDYGYTGSVNPDGRYTMVYRGYNSSLPIKKGDKLSIVLDEDIYTEDADLTIESAGTEEEKPVDPTGAATSTINGIEYTVYPTSGVFFATDGSKAKGNVTLLETYEHQGKTLTLAGIAANAFAGNNNLNGITMPDGAKSIGDNAFKDCEYLQSVTLPSSLKSIGNYAFFNCSYLSTIDLPASVSTVGTGAFSKCTDLNEFNFNGTGIKEIPASMFEGCERLTEVDIPASVKTIGMGAFAASGVVKIGSTAGITDVADNAFAGSRLVEFTFGPEIKTIGVVAFSGTGIKSAKLSKSLTRLGQQAFSDCASLAEVVLPSTFTEIGEATFENCSSLHMIEIPKSVTSIADRAFFNSGLVSVTIHDGITSLGQSSLAGSSLVSVTLGTGITTLANMPISTEGMLRLNTTNPPILNNQRLGCTPAIVIVPQGSGEAYRKSTRWKEYNIVEDNGTSGTVYVNTPGELARDITSQMRVMPAEVTNMAIKGELNKADFKVIRSNMTSLYKLDLSGVTNSELPDEAFSGKISLIEVTLPSKLAVIGKSAFAGCSLMKLAGLPSTLTTIGENAFDRCYAMSGALNFPASLTTIGASAFSNCYTIGSADLGSTKITAVEDNTFANCISMRSISLPRSVRSIGDNAFFNSGLERPVIPSGVKTIGESAFAQCVLMTAIQLPSAVNKIGASAFANSGLTYINFPDEVETIEDETLADCHDLYVVNLPSKLTYLGNRAVASSTVSAITAPAAKPAETGLNPFQGINNYTCGLSIPGMSFNDYLSAEYWGAFVGMRNNIDITIDEGIDVSYIDENDYQEIMSGGTLLQSPRKRALAVMKASGAVAADHGYGKLRDGSQLYRGDNSRTRFFFDIPSNVTIFKITYNSKDITKEIDKATGSWVAPDFTASASLKVEVDPAGIQDLTTDSATDPGHVYNLQGTLILKSATQEQIDALAPGFYIVGGKKIVK
ncbi:MAG: leucine-rich repeat protein [Muribaculaceae bacterium]|nr:leucine-rich repeat protein [Muribaculaceae bacterium]